MVEMGMPGCVEDSLETCRAVRNELQVFAQKELRSQLSELRSKLRDDFRAELNEVQTSMIPGSSTLSLRSIGTSQPAGKSHFSNPTRKTLNPPLSQTSSLRSTAFSEKQGISPKPPAEPTTLLDVETFPQESTRGKQSYRSDDSHGFDDAYEVVHAERHESAERLPKSAKQSLAAFSARGTEPGSSRVSRRYLGINRLDVKEAYPSHEMHKASSARTTKLFFTHVKSAFKSAKAATAQQTHPPVSGVNEPSEMNFWERWCQGFAAFADYPIAIVILFNGIFLGIQTQYQSSNMTQAVPPVFPVFEVLFCIVFTAEIIGRLIRHRHKFFYKAGWRWNVFDLCLVMMQVTEVIGMFTTEHETENAPATANVSYLRLLRILRIFRVLRLVRLLQFIGELNIIISSIANSMRSLFWTMVLLLLLIYIVGIIFTQIVFSHRMSNKEALSTSKDQYDTELEYWFGSLARTTLSLYEAILGGADWDSLVYPLVNKISIVLGPMFMLYIAFSLLAMMNVITGIFVESALKNAAKDKELEFYTASKDLFREGDRLDTNRVTQDQFRQELNKSRLPAFLRQVGIEVQDAELMFTLLDADGAGEIDLDDLLAGLLRLRSGAKVLDIALLMHETEAQHTSEMESFNMLEDFFAHKLKNLISSSRLQSPPGNKPAFILR